MKYTIYYHYGNDGRDEAMAEKDFGSDGEALKYCEMLEDHMDSSDIELGDWYFAKRSELPKRKEGGIMLGEKAVKNMARKQFTPSERLRRMNSYNAQYSKEHYTNIAMKLSKKDEADVLGWLDAQPNRKAAIVALIRAEIANGSK